jgi:hypothetical protein
MGQKPYCSGDCHIADAQRCHTLLFRILNKNVLHFTCMYDSKVPATLSGFSLGFPKTMMTISTPTYLYIPEVLPNRRTRRLCLEPLYHRMSHHTLFELGILCVPLNFNGYHHRALRHRFLSNIDCSPNW